jgi:hypothetical protein
MPVRKARVHCHLPRLAPGTRLGETQHALDREETCEGQYGDRVAGTGLDLVRLCLSHTSMSVGDAPRDEDRIYWERLDLG